jgi:hypothetical protein
MTKTAEEILNQHLNRSIPDGVSMWDSAINSSKEFAAQEVEAYKARLKSELSKRYEAKILQQVEYSYVEQLIDAVK